MTPNKAKKMLELITACDKDIAICESNCENCDFGKIRNEVLDYYSTLEKDYQELKQKLKE